MIVDQRKQGIELLNQVNWLFDCFTTLLLFNVPFQPNAIRFLQSPPLNFPGVELLTVVWHRIENFSIHLKKPRQKKESESRVESKFDLIWKILKKSWHAIEHVTPVPRELVPRALQSMSVHPFA